MCVFVCVCVLDGGCRKFEEVEEEEEEARSEGIPFVWICVCVYISESVLPMRAFSSHVTQEIVVAFLFC